MSKKYRSEAFAAIHETMEALHDVGAINKQTMREFDETCLSPFFRVPSVVAPNYAPIVAHLKLVVILRLAWHINSVASDKHSNAALRRYFVLHCDWHALHSQD